ncbi:hypothetical protein LTR56_017589 [Elasticomyces elasticus]|nr:hypothetical protein LTR56_017589 [Elasticomyces elasticus]KAK3630772.1 hypothetical protein LTR22_021351 [Elasticomyces elasticus]KAK4909186.1 hypothetical protein LTR49_022009 [Elasticomyces elasticus]KAK5749283.1 hypothetical protein LTS12_020663 [Elasticomyces elasticus]
MNQDSKSTPMPRRTAPDHPFPKATDKPSLGAPDVQVPALRGRLGRLVVWLLEHFPLLSRYLYKRSALSKLHALNELDLHEQRYLPVVTPVPEDGMDSVARASEADTQRDIDYSDGRLPPSSGSGRLLSVADYHAAYSSGKVNPSAVVKGLLPIIRRDLKQPHEHSIAFRHTNVALTLKAARASDERWHAGKPLGVLDGVPIAIKDEADVEGWDRSDGGLVATVGTFTMFCIQKWVEQGAIVIGISCMPEYGSDPTGRNHVLGLPRNPYNPEYATGGSSAGSGYAIAQGIVPIALGADGGGSIRIPSSWCGIFGLKPSHHRTSMRPGAALASTTSVYGPMAANMVDLEVAYRTMAVPDTAFPVSTSYPPPKKYVGPRNKVLGVCRSWLDRAEPRVREACETAIQYLAAEQGYRVVEISLPFLNEGQMSHIVTLFSEIRASISDSSGLTLENRFFLSFFSAVEARDFLFAQKIRNILMEHLSYLFEQYPGLIIVTPVTPDPATPIRPEDAYNGITDLAASARVMEYVWLANFSGTPCLTFPVAYVQPSNSESVSSSAGKGRVPVGIMGMGEWGSEDALIEFGYDGERFLHEALGGGRQRPAGWVDVLELARSTL